MISLGLKIDIISKLDDDISIYQNNFCSNYMINNVYIDIYMQMNKNIIFKSSTF